MNRPAKAARKDPAGLQREHGRLQSGGAQSPGSAHRQANRHLSGIRSFYAKAGTLLPVKPEELLLTNGGDDALRVFFDTFVEPRTDVLICEPTFPMYRYYAEIAGARVKVQTRTEHGVPAR